MRATVLGAGSWGTTFAKVLVDAGVDTTLWARRSALADVIDGRHVNPDYLPQISLPAALRSTSDAAAATRGAELVAIAVTAQTLRSNLAAWQGMLPPEATVVSLMKGVELGTAKRMSEVIAEAGGVRADRIAVLSGPNLAGEIAQEMPTASVIAGLDATRVRELQDACSTGYFRPYTSQDVVGCELGGAVKNVIALACGMCLGLGFGDNTLATIVTRGLAETSRLGEALGADPRTFAGLAGMGDLVATCASPLSRNRTFGERLGRGETVEQAQAATRGQVAEGVKSCQAVVELADRVGVDVPISRAVEQVCHYGGSPAELGRALMARSTRSEQ